jgi:hypothetical protein
MSAVNLINQFENVAFKKYTLSLAQDKESLTLEQLFNFLKETLDKNPSLKDASVNHIEFGGLTTTTCVTVHDDNDPTVIFK